MAVADDDKDVPAVEGSKDGDPEDQEDYADAVTRHAKYLGIDPGRHSEYLWIAEEVREREPREGWYRFRGQHDISPRSRAACFCEAGSVRVNVATPL